MGHPYNQTQKIEIQNLSAQRFVGTDIQKNLFYGRDIPVLRYEWTFENKPVPNDYVTYKYDLLTSGDFVKLYWDVPRLRAEPKFNVRGEPHDYPLIAPTYSGALKEISFDRPSIAPTQSGFLEPCVREVTWDNFRYVQSYVKYIDWDEPKVGITPKGGMLGITMSHATDMGYVFETGFMYAGDHIPTEYDVPESTETHGDGAAFFFYTGRYDGPSS